MVEITQALQFKLGTSDILPMSCEKVAHVGSWKNGPFQIYFRKIASKQRRARPFIYNKYTKDKKPMWYLDKAFTKQKLSVQGI